MDGVQHFLKLLDESSRKSGVVGAMSRQKVGQGNVRSRGVSQMCGKGRSDVGMG